MGHRVQSPPAQGDLRRARIFHGVRAFHLTLQCRIIRVENNLDDAYITRCSKIYPATTGERKRCMNDDKPRNPFILNFCEALIKKRGLELSEEKKEKELDRMYNLYESMLGRRMVEALPDDKKAQYMAITKDPGQLSFEKIGEIFAEGVPDPQAIMQETLKEFSDIYLKNR